MSVGGLRGDDCGFLEMLGVFGLFFRGGDLLTFAGRASRRERVDRSVGS